MVTLVTLCDILINIKKQIEATQRNNLEIRKKKIKKDYDLKNHLINIRQ